MTIESLAAIVGVVVLVGGVVIYLLRQRGGEGPPVGDGVPRSLRPLANAWYGVNRWPIPFDRDGDLIPVEKRERAR